MSKVLIASVDLGCSDEILTILSMLSAQNIFYRPKEKQAQVRGVIHQPNAYCNNIVDCSGSMYKFLTCACETHMRHMVKARSVPFSDQRRTTPAACRQCCMRLLAEVGLCVCEFGLRALKSFHLALSGVQADQKRAKFFQPEGDHLTLQLPPVHD
jgi:HrpA-like RNA helicase